MYDDDPAHEVSELVANCDPVELAASEFLEAWRDGVCPSIPEWLAAHPNEADALRELLPFALALEECRSSSSLSLPNQSGSDFEPGRQVGGFRIVQEIGRGGMGVVYQAVEIASERRVALKLVPIQPNDWQSPTAPVWREPSLTAQLNHANIVPVYACGQERGYRYFAMRLVPAVGLDRLIQLIAKHPDGITPQRIHNLVQLRIGRDLPVATTSASSSPLGTLHSQSWLAFARIGWQIAKALRYAHTQSVLHRDIKPGNVLIDIHGAAWISDFGLAVAAEQPRAKDRWRVAGTLPYMAPEQIDGKVTVRTDIYGWGITMYELCTQQRAFAAEDRESLMQLIRKGRCRPPRQIHRTLPRELERIILRAMAAKPTRRYHSFDQLNADLSRFLRSQAQRHRNWWGRWFH